MSASKVTQWHPAFCSAIKLEMRENQGDLDYFEEYNLSNKPLQIDLLIIEKNDNVQIKNEIGRLFRRYNILEYKGPGDELNIDTLYKTIGYACIYKGLGERVDAIPGNELTITLIRWSVPNKLFKQLSESGYEVVNNHNGIFYINGLVNMPIQIVVSSLLTAKEHLSLRMLSKNVNEEDAKSFILEYCGVQLPGDKQNVDAILQVSVNENRLLFDKIRRKSPEMCEALKDLMKEEIAEAVAAGEARGEARGEAKGEARGEIKSIIKLVLDGTISPETGVEKTNLTVEAFKALIEEYQTTGNIVLN